jgi:putative ATPase
VFHGPSGTGKTALARIIAIQTKSEFIRMNAVTAKTDDLRDALKQAGNNRSLGKPTLLFIDEIHRFNKMVQDGLLPALEQGTVTMIGTTTTNPFHHLIPPLRSRVLLFEFRPLQNQDLRRILDRAASLEKLELDQDAADLLVKASGGDGRRMLNLLETSAALGPGTITTERVQQVAQKQNLHYDRNEDYHYDVISAFIKSIRGSDPDAALYWLVNMLNSGEDPLFIARRLTILASEDVGLADPLALLLADAACRSVERVGMPEGRLILAHLTLYLSLQPKSSSSYLALEQAQQYLEDRGSLPVPDHLRSSHPGSKKYKYPHDFPYHYTQQQYYPGDASFYTPGELGAERELKKRLLFLRNLHKEEPHE